ncbi:hypothetical protein QE152_g31519 [Popillia japonica]|uniref:Uncharacterized protein n=1 Tax=Popillia japonica TaxID=7064 RepID=A0AAW1J0V4_POPJA
MKNRLQPHAIPTLFLCDPVKPLTATELVDASPTGIHIEETIPTQSTVVPSTSTKLHVISPALIFIVLWIYSSCLRCCFCSSHSFAAYYGRLEKFNIHCIW